MNSCVVKMLLEMFAPKTRMDAETTVTVAIWEYAAKRKLPSSAASGNKLDTFAEKIVRQFENRYGNCKPRERDAEVRYVLELVQRVINRIMYAARLILW